MCVYDITIGTVTSAMFGRGAAAAGGADGKPAGSTLMMGLSAGGGVGGDRRDVVTIGIVCWCVMCQVTVRHFLRCFYPNLDV